MPKFARYAAVYSLCLASPGKSRATKNSARPQTLVSKLPGSRVAVFLNAAREDFRSTLPTIPECVLSGFDSCFGRPTTLKILNASKRNGKYGKSSGYQDEPLG